MQAVRIGALHSFKDRGCSVGKLIISQFYSMWRKESE